MAIAPFEFTLKFAAGIGAVDAAKGILRGVTVAEVGEATGHFAFIDEAGKVIGVGGAADAAAYPKAKRRLPLGMDEASLDTVVAAALKSKRVKTREDHDDSIKSRAGFSEAFRREGAKVVCDLNILDAYTNRAVFMETATKTPELIGLSGDFKFTAEVIGERALMRVSGIDAVDIVDRGALTHSGLFSVKPQTAQEVDIPANSKPDTQKMTPAEIAALATELKTQLTAELTASFSAKLTEAVTTATTAAKSEGEKAAKAELVEFKKGMSALGLKPGEAPALSADAAAEKAKQEAADAAAAAEKAKNAPADFLSLKASVAKERNVTPVEATQIIIREKPEVYSAHLKALGVTKR